ncbi:MAG: ATP-binding cassette domain-containing protein, partial [Cyanobacteria bacterium J06639_1]
MNGKTHPSSTVQPTAKGSLAIDVADLSKTYRTGFYMNQLVTPLEQCSFSVSAGETFGLLGPNGAGKTTTIKCLLGIVSPTSGTGTLLGKPLGD